MRSPTECPICGYHSRIISTGPCNYGSHKTRKCYQCGKTWQVYEVLPDYIHRLQKSHKLLMSLLKEVEIALDDSPDVV